MDKEQAQVTTENHVEESAAYRFGYEFGRKYADLFANMQPVDYAELPAHDAACDAIDNEVLRYVSPEEILRLKEELKTRYTSTPRNGKANSRTAKLSKEYLEGADGTGAEFKLLAVLVYLMLNNPDTCSVAEKHFEEWAELCATDGEAMGQITGAGFAEDIPLLQMLYNEHMQAPVNGTGFNRKAKRELQAIVSEVLAERVPA